MKPGIDVDAGLFYCPFRLKSNEVKDLGFRTDDLRAVILGL
jgi:hypothetical protein